MAVVGFNFTKMHIERKGDARGKISIKNNVAITDVSTTDMSLGKAKQKGLKISFEFKSFYEPELAEILFEGNILDMQDEKKVDELQKGWDKDKKLPDNLMEPLVNSILNRCNVQSLLMSKELNLPPPIPMPKVSSQNVTTSTKKSKK